jgi:hypothetical protein
MSRSGVEGACMVASFREGIAGTQRAWVLSESTHSPTGERMSALLLVLATLTASAPAAPPLVPAAEAQEVRLRPGRELAVSTPTGELRGTLTAVEPGALKLELPDGSVREVPLAEVGALGVRRGNSPAFAMWGASMLGWTGGTLGTLFVMLANGIREYGDATPVQNGTLLVGVLGAGIGAGTGALIGLASSSWPSVYAADPGRPLRLTPSAQESGPLIQRRAVELGLGLGVLLDPDELGRTMEGARTRLHLLIPASERLSVGAEASLGELDHFYDRGLERDEDLTQYVTDVGLRARYWLAEEGGSFRPLVSAGLALQYLSQHDEGAGPFGNTVSTASTGLGLTLGAGVDWVPVPGAPGLTFEVAWRQGMAAEARASHLELGITSALRF